jgi:2-oxoglutarate ferredoxin oxidoreductase subunit beta
VNGVTEADLLVHDQHAEDPYLALILSRMFWPEFPVPVGIMREVERPTHSDLVDAQIEQAKAKSGEGDLTAALLAGEIWTVE